jgi:hypothetical protein
MNCDFGKSIEENGLDRFSVRFLRIQKEVCYEEIGDEMIEGNQIVCDAAGADVMELVGEEHFINQGRSIIRCLQDRYLGNCSLSGCTQATLVSEAITEATAENHKLAL